MARCRRRPCRDRLRTDGRALWTVHREVKVPTAARTGGRRRPRHPDASCRGVQTCHCQPRANGFTPGFEEQSPPVVPGTRRRSRHTVFVASRPRGGRAAVPAEPGDTRDRTCGGGPGETIPLNRACCIRLRRTPEYGCRTGHTGTGPEARSGIPFRPGSLRVPCAASVRGCGQGNNRSKLPLRAQHRPRGGAVASGRCNAACTARAAVGSGFGGPTGRIGVIWQVAVRIRTESIWACTEAGKAGCGPAARVVGGCRSGLGGLATARQTRLSAGNRP